MEVIIMFAIASIAIIVDGIDNECHLPEQSNAAQVEYCETAPNVDMRVGTIDNVFIITTRF